MNRKELKEKAKKLIAGNKWYIWKPLVIFNLIVFAIIFVVAFILAILNTPQNTVAVVIAIISVIISFFEMAFMIGYAKYTLEFVRDKKMDWKEIIEFSKKHFGLCLLVSILVGLIIVAGSILLIIPGIIAAIGLTFYQEVCADNTNLSATEIIKKAWNMTNNHKMDIFVLMLSFIGWEILAGFTLGILYIWLMPYMLVTLLLAYEKLKK